MKSIIKTILSALLLSTLLINAYGCVGALSKSKSHLENVNEHFGTEIPQLEALYSNVDSQYFVYSVQGTDKEEFIEKNKLSREKDERIEKCFQEVISYNKYKHEKYDEDLIPEQFIPDYDSDYCWRFISSEGRYRQSEDGKRQLYYVYDEDFDSTYNYKLYLFLDTDKGLLYINHILFR